ncbi:MAG: zf-HC2 domain-containing protein [Acidobacteriia bacterium]|nr:zf-HC2 domain-containing protein [Terriglobia bacterium]
MSEHESIRELLSLAAAGVLAPDDQRRVEQHAAVCDACRRQLEVWQSYSRELVRLPAPAAPRHLAERTRARVLEQRAAVAQKRWDDIVLAVLVLFGWTMTLVTWIVFRLFTGGMLSVLEFGFVRIVIWSGASTLFAWLTAAVAAVMLGSQRRAVRRML